jgi:glucose/arabinose dehydrogenase
VHRQADSIATDRTAASGIDRLSRPGSTGLKLPFGIAFYPNNNDPEWVYVANTDSVVRFHYRNGDLHAGEKPEVVVKRSAK